MGTALFSFRLFIFRIAFYKSNTISGNTVCKTDTACGIMRFFESVSCTLVVYLLIVFKKFDGFRTSLA